MKPELIPNKDFFDTYKEAVLVASNEHGIVYVNPMLSQLISSQFLSTRETQHAEILNALKIIEPHLANSNHRFIHFPAKNSVSLKLRVSESPIALSDLSAAQLYTFTAIEAIGNAKEGERKFYELANASPALIFLEDKNEQAFFFNTAWLEFTGKPLEQLIGTGWKNSIFPADHKILAGNLPEITHHNSYSCEYRLLKFDGTYRNIFAIGTPVLADDGSFNGYMTSCLDITEVEETQTKINQLTGELKHLNEELEQFTYVTSHDLQEPLRMITGYIQLIEKNIERGNLEAVPEFMNFVVTGASRMQMLIADLVKLSRVNRKGAPFAAVDMKEVLNVSITHLAKKINATSAKIEYGQLPVINGDTFQLVMLIENILDNALKFTSLDKQPHITISVDETDEQYIFSVKDNGIGIDNKFHKRIFAIFQRLHTRGEYEGTGIGLAVCKKIVERHGGEMWVESEPLNGSTFYFSIKK